MEEEPDPVLLIKEGSKINQDDKDQDIFRG